MPTKRPIESYRHDSAARANNPPAGLVNAANDPDAPPKRYAFDPHLDPQLVWAGKAERLSFDIPTVSLHEHERIDPRSIIEAVRKRNGDGQAAQPPLFESPAENPPLRQAVEFYAHPRNWSNRLVAGDSLLVMNSLIEKEALAGKVQMIYFDPPYGIKYGSNFQPFVHKRDVKDGDDNSLTAEPEQLAAFRDTWELGIHSYLAYLRDRLIVARELLTDSGSIFVQIGDENVHRVGMAMDDIFGAQNRVATISFAKTSGSSANLLPQVADYLLWYAKDANQAKYRQLYEPLTRTETVEYFSSYAMVELADGTCRRLTREERIDPDGYLPDGARLYRRTGLDSQGASVTGRSEPYEWNGQVFQCPPNRQWSISMDGMDHLSEIGRLDAGQGGLSWKRYEDEVPGRRISNLWPVQAYPPEKRYVVETSTKVVQRCMLMTTDPGDLVFDPTCGSGVTAFVAEQWGRRWVTCDTSRVAVTLAKQRLMTALYEYYELAYPNEGVGSGFAYKSVPYVSPKVLAGDAPASAIVLYDQPKVDASRRRVSGPFTVEAVPAVAALSVDELADAAGFEPADEAESDASAEPSAAPLGLGGGSRSGEGNRQEEWRGELAKTGIRGKAGQHLRFARLEPLPGFRRLHADGQTLPDADGNGGASQRVVVSFGPDHAPLEQRQVEDAVQEARTLVPPPEIVVFAAFQFDPEAAKDIDETRWPGVALLKAQMNADLLTEDLKRKRASNESFWLVGQPDVEVETIADGADAGKLRAHVRGFDYYDTQSGALYPGGEKDIAMWLLDPDYDGRSLYPRQAFFPMAGPADGWARLARNLRAEIDESLIEAYRGTASLPFEPGEHRRAAVKIVDARGVESLRALDLG